jgi:hypothetical protein
MDSIVRQQTIPDGLLRHTIVLRQSPPAPKSFTAADTTQTIFLFGLPARHVITGVIARLVATFTGFGLSSCNVIIGGTSQTNGAITTTNFYLGNGSPSSFSCTQSALPTISLGPYVAQNLGGGSSNFGVFFTSSYPTNYFVGATVTVIDGPNAGVSGTVIGSSQPLLPGSSVTELVMSGWSVDPSGHNVVISRVSTGTPMMYWSPFAMYTTDPQDIKATFTSAGAQLASLTAGEIEFTILYRPL